jgi:hypothetical protein
MEESAVPDRGLRIEAWWGSMGLHARSSRLGHLGVMVSHL